MLADVFQAALTAVILTMLVETACRFAADVVCPRCWILWFPVGNKGRPFALMVLVGSRDPQLAPVVNWLNDSKGAEALEMCTNQ